MKKFALTTIARKKAVPYIDGKVFPIETGTDIIEFYKQFGELPFNDYSELNEDVIYQFYVEYYKKFKIHRNEFFTPDELSQKAVDVLTQYVDIDNTLVLDAFCGTGSIQRYLNPQNSIGFDINTDFLAINEYFGRKCFYHDSFDIYQKKINSLSEKLITPMSGKFKAIVSNPPFGKYLGTNIDRLLIDFFYDSLDVDGMLVLIAPTNFIEKYEKLLTNRLILCDTVLHNIDFDYTGAKTSIFVLGKTQVIQEESNNLISSDETNKTNKQVQITAESQQLEQLSLI